MRKILFSSFLLVLSSVVFVPLASAHVLMTDKNIGAVLHIDPDDAPIAGQQSSFFFEFKDATNKFNPSDCQCTFSITEQGKEIYSQPLFQNTTKPSLTNASVFYTFPQQDVYQIAVVGQPNTSGEFQSFKLTYNIRVDQGTDVSHNEQPNTSKPPVYLWVGFFVILVLFAGFVIYNHKKDHKNDDKKN